MNKLLKGLSTTTLAAVCLLGATGCGKEKAKKIDVEENYATANTAALAVSEMTSGEKGFFLKTEMTMEVKASLEGVNMDVKYSGTMVANHVGDNYYLLTSGDMFGGEMGQAIITEDGVHTGYMWEIMENPFTGDVEEDYAKQVIAAEDLDQYTGEFDLLSEDIGFLSIFQGDYADFQANVEAAIDGLRDEESITGFMDIDTMIDTAVYEIEATELDGVKTFTITVKMADEATDSGVDISYALSVENDKVTKIKTIIDIDMVAEGVPTTNKVTATQTFGYEGKTDSKYTKLPAAEKFN